MRRKRGKRRKRKRRRSIASEDISFCGLLNLSRPFKVGAVLEQEIYIYLFMAALGLTEFFSLLS